MQLSTLENQLPQFNQIDISSVPVKLAHLLETNRKNLSQLLAQKNYTWDNLMQPLEEANEALSQFWSPITHLHGVMESEELRKVYNECLPLLTAYHTELNQNENLYKAILSIMESNAFATLNAAQRKIIENDIRDFKLSGVHLPVDKKLRLAQLQQELSQLMTKFSENLLDATNAWTLHIQNKDELQGLTEQALQLSRENASKRGLDGYVLTLDFPSYSTAIKSLENRELRKKLYEAYVTRASDQGPDAGKWDNTQMMENILKVRDEIAKLVGFPNFAELSLATKMAKTPGEVLNFLYDLLKRSKPVALAEYQELVHLAHAEDKLTPVEVWDIAYYSEKLRESKFQFTQEELRPYFPINKVLTGMFGLVEKIYGISIKEVKEIEVWHPDVKFFSITDDKQQLRAGFYIDLYARPHKRDGAWMDDCRTRRLIQGNGLQYPVAYLTCNFMPPVSNQPALLTHDDVLTLFHEFGHCLQHMLTQVDYASVAGINGVPWDAVEFPSQFMENFCLEKEVLNLIAGHFETGAPLPETLYEKMIAAKYFQTGLQMVRQLEFSIFDFRLHLEFDPDKSNQIQTLLDEVRKEAAVMSIPSFNRFQHSFAHIFAGAYGAGYYSYKWAEVLSADAYSAFEENGIFDPKTGHSFMKDILEVGGVYDPMQTFIAFRGRPPKIDALLVQNGLA